MLSQGLSPILLLSIVLGYFLVLMVISHLSSKGASNQDFFNANKQSPWYLVAIGMIGASLSGVTFISVPGWVADSQFSYMQLVFGYLLGYLVIGTILMPMYYKLNLTSIYTYLEKRFGFYSYKTGAAFFLLSRTVQASFRLYLVAVVLYEFVLSDFGISFPLTVAITILLIWVYTYRGGIKTIVLTDVLQTFFMLGAAIITILTIANSMNLSLGNVFMEVKNSEYSKMLFFEGGWADEQNFFKSFLAGASITIVMTGLDQDMMQKNLSCRNIKEAQKNMFWFNVILVFANVIFLSLGVLLYQYAAQIGITLPEKSDLLYPTLALNHMSPIIGVVFILGLIAAAYSSADSALTSLTTSYCVDFLGFQDKTKEFANKKRTRVLVHLAFSVILLIVIIIFYHINDDAVIAQIFRVAVYTYGPLLGLYAVGFFSKVKIHDKLAPWICILSPILTYIINVNSEAWLGGYVFGFELLILNGLITAVGLLLSSMLSKAVNKK